MNIVWGSWNIEGFSLQEYVHIYFCIAEARFENMPKIEEIAQQKE